MACRNLTKNEGTSSRQKLDLRAVDSTLALPNHETAKHPMLRCVVRPGRHKFLSGRKKRKGQSSTLWLVRSNSEPCAAVKRSQSLCTKRTRSCQRNDCTWMLAWERAGHTNPLTTSSPPLKCFRSMQAFDSRLGQSCFFKQACSQLACRFCQLTCSGAHQRLELKRSLTLVKPWDKAGQGPH